MSAAQQAHAEVQIAWQNLVCTSLKRCQVSMFDHL
jgi:hypothetical protein